MQCQTNKNAVPDQEPQQEQHLRSAAFLPWQERRERSDAATRSNLEQRLAAQMTALQSTRRFPPEATSAFLEALNAAHHPLALYPPQQIRTDSFSQAFFDYLRPIDRLLSMPSLLPQCSDLQAKLPRGAFSDCPICALVQGELEVKLGNLCSRAFAEGVTDETAAIAACKDSHLTPKTSHVGQWVDQQLRLKALEAMASGKGQAPTRLPSISLSTDMAQLQLRGLRGPHEQRMAVHGARDSARLKCMELETAHGVHALEKEKHGSAEGESPLNARGLVLMVEGQVS
ncbi:hypothetical protein HaLaN_00733, partial [Haematococcus lacustris]